MRSRERSAVAATLFVGLLGGATEGCHRLVCAPPPGPDSYESYYASRAAVAEARLPFRVLDERQVGPGDDRVEVFSRASQYDRSGADFETEEVLRITARAAPGSPIAWIIGDGGLIVKLDAGAFTCSKSAHRTQIDVAIPRSLSSPWLYVARRRNTGCDPPPEPCALPKTSDLAPTGSKPVPTRGLVEGPPRSGGDPSLVVFTHASQWPAGGVDFDRERIVRITDLNQGDVGVLWVAETESEVLVGVREAVACGGAGPRPGPPQYFAIPQSTKPVYIQRISGPGCSTNERLP